MLKIWGRNTSINVQKVMWAIGELGIPHERIDVGGAFGQRLAVVHRDRRLIASTGRGKHRQTQYPDERYKRSSTHHFPH